MKTDKLYVIKDNTVNNELHLSRKEQNSIIHFVLEWIPSANCYHVALNETGINYYHKGTQYWINKQDILQPQGIYPLKDNDFICRKKTKIEIVKDGQELGTQLFLHYGDKPYLFIKDIAKQRSKGVYICIDIGSNNNLVVLKLRHKQSSQIARFKRSARLLNNVSLYIPRIVDVGELTLNDVDYEYQSFEYFRGQSLHRKLPLEQKDAAVIFHQVAMAIYDLHRAGVQHRNLKPEHILIDEHYQVKLVGLTLVKKSLENIAESDSGVTLTGNFSHESELALSLPGEIVGSNSYSPFTVTDPKVKDIYCIASIFVYCIQREKQQREKFRSLVTREEMEVVAANLGKYLKNIPEKLKELLERILIRGEYISAYELTRCFADVYSYISQNIEREDQYPMPETIEIPGTQVAMWYSPLEELGGDFYDCIPMGRNKYALLIGDTMGHGIKACLYTHLIYPVAQLFAHQRVTPIEILQKMDSLLYKSGRARKRAAFATAIYGILSLDEDFPYFMFANAGHPPPILYRKGHDFASPQASLLELGNGPLLGSKLGLGSQHFRPSENFIQLQREDILILYTDGIMEATNENGEYYETRFVEIVEQMGEAGAVKLLDGVQKDVRKFGDDKNTWAKDDISIIAIQLLAKAGV